MKKLLLLIALISCNLFVSAGINDPDIFIDEVNAEGHRFIQTDEKVSSFSLFSGNNNVVNVSVIGIDNTCTQNIFVNIKVIKSYNISIKEGSPILLKTKDDDVFRTTNILNSGKYYDTDIVGGIAVDYYKLNCRFKIDDDVLEAIKKGILKVRLEINDAPFDINFKKLSMSKFIYKGYELVKERLEQQKNFEDDF